MCIVLVTNHHVGMFMNRRKPLGFLWAILNSRYSTTSAVEIGTAGWDFRVLSSRTCLEEGWLVSFLGPQNPFVFTFLQITLQHANPAFEGRPHTGFSPFCAHHASCVNSVAALATEERWTIGGNDTGGSTICTPQGDINTPLDGLWPPSVAHCITNCPYLAQTLTS